MGHPGPSPWTAIVDRAQCDRLTEEMTEARAVTERYPTVADAEEAGWFRVTGYVPGIAAHYMNFGLVDNEFHIDEPEMLLFDGNEPDSRIVGLSYYVRQDGTAGPTQGFVGENDSYHRHFGLCVGRRWGHRRLDHDRGGVRGHRRHQVHRHRRLDEPRLGRARLREPVGRVQR